MEKKPFSLYRFREQIDPDVFEKMASSRGLWVCGIDEAGRGPSAGPVVAAAAIVRLDGGKRGLLRDSKIMTPQERIMAYQWIIQNSWYGVGIVNSRCIDEIGIYKANIIAMHRAFAQLQASCPVALSMVLVDAVPLELPPIAIHGPEMGNGGDENDLLNNPWHKIIYFPHSEQYSYSIAAASIIAKVTRDAVMDSLALSFPCHNLAVHKGYHTVKHRALLREHGPTIIHRASFLHKKEECAEAEEVMSLF
jgi:ribonuclease HII